MAVSGLVKIDKPEKLEQLRKEIKEKAGLWKKSVRICIGTGCAAKGSNTLYRLFQEAAADTAVKVITEAKCVGCHGFCERGPIVAIEPGNIIYQGVTEPDVAEIFRESILSNNIVERLLYKNPSTGETAKTEEEIPFYQLQRRIVLAENGRIDPTDIEDYIGSGG
jgi:NADH-quinone oxidoreductase subunit F